MNTPINIALYGQAKGSGGSDDTRLIFTFPNQNAMQTNEQWLKGLFDPRDARKLIDADSVYALWSSSEGNYYGLIVPANDGRNGRQLLCVHVGHRLASSGRIVLSTLRFLKTLLIDNGIKDDTLINNNLEELKNSLISDNSYYQASASSSSKGLRQYHGEKQLEQLFTFPRQKAYKGFQCIYIVSDEVDLSSVVGFTHISEPIKVIYRVMKPLPSGVSVDKTDITAGDTLTITYTKEGCEPEVDSVVINGLSSKYVLCVDNELYINDAERAEVRFNRRVLIDFVEEGTNKRINYVTIRSFKGKQNVADSVLIAETEQTASFTALATGYHEKNVTLNHSDILSGRYKVELKPKSAEQTIEIVFPDYTSSTIKARVKQNDPLYKYLQRTNGQIHVSRRDFQKPKYSGDNYEDDSSSKSFWQKIPNWLLYAAIAAIAALLVFCVWKFWPSSDDNGEEAEETKTEQVDSKQAEPQTQEFNEADFNADLAYMKDHEQWNKLDLKTDDFKNLIDYISNGQVPQAVAHPYKNNDLVNGHWNAILSIIEQHNDDSQFMSRVPDEMRKCCKNESANIQKLHSALELLLQKNDNHVGRETTNPSPNQAHQTTNRQNSTNINRSTTTNTNVTNGASATNSSNSVNNNTTRTRGSE